MSDIERLDAALAVLSEAVAALPRGGAPGTLVTVDATVLATIRAAFETVDEGGRRNVRPTAWGGRRASIADAMRAAPTARRLRQGVDRGAEGAELPRRTPGTSGR